MANQIKYQVGFDVQKQGLNDLKSSLQQLQKMKLSDIMKINNTDIASARQTFKKISDDAKMVENALEKAFNPKLNTVNVEKFKDSLKGMDLTGLYNSFSKAGAAGESAFRNLTTQVLGTNTTLKQSHALLDKMATTLGNTIKWHAASAAINGVSRSVQQAWGYVKHLDNSLNDIRIVTGKSSEEMAKFAEQANNAAKSLGKTTTDYTDAALIYAQQGLSDKEIQKRTEITLKTAGVTGQSADAVSDQLTAVWNGYKVNADEAELYVDRLAAVAATTASNLEELSKGMGKVAAAANQMGVGEDQLAAQLSTIISVTKQAPESVGTALRTVYARISDIQAGIDEDGVSLGNYSGKMKELGFNVLDANGKLRNMGQVVEQIGGRWNNLTREQQVNLAQTMAGQRQYSNLMALFENFDKYTAALQTAQGAAGTLQQQQDIYMESTAAHLNQLKAAKEDVFDSLVDTESINDLVDVFTKITEGVANFVDSIGGGGELLKSLGAIALTVFNQQIAQSLLTTINNFKNASEQADILKAKIAANQELINSGVGNDTTKYVVGEQKDLLQMNGRLPSGQMNELQQSLDKFAQASGDFEVAQEKLNRLKTAFEQAGISIADMVKEYGSFDNFLTSGDGFDLAESALVELREKYDPVLQKQNQLRQSIEKMNNDTSMDNIKASVESMTGVFDKLGTKAGQGIFDSLSKGAQESVQVIIQEMDKINNPDLSAQQKVDLIGEQYANLRWVIANEISSINQTLQAAKNQDKSLTQEQVKDLERRKKAFEDFYKIKKGKAGQQMQAQQFIEIAGGISQMSRALQQFQNLGSIWKNQDLTVGQKVLQTITNLSFSLPMLINGYNKLNGALKLVITARQMQTAATAASTVATTTDTVAKTGLIYAFAHVGTAAQGAAGKIILFNGALAVNPIFLAVAAVAALATAFGFLKKRAEQANKAAIENAKQTVDEQNQIQEQINKRKELYDSLNSLNQKYKDHEITRTELKGQIQDLIKQYNLQQSQIATLIQGYNDLGKAISEARQIDAKNAHQAALDKKDAAKTQVEETGNGINKDSSFSVKDIKTDADNKIMSQLSKYKQLYKEGLGSTFTIGPQAEDIVKAYDIMKEKLDSLNLSQEQMNKSQVYKSINEWLSKMKQSVESYKEAIDQVNQTDIAEKGLQAIADNKVNFDSINNLDDYKKQRQALIKQLGSGENADNFLKNQFTSIYNQYNEASTLIDNLREKLGGTNSEVESMIGKMDDAKFSALIESIGLDGSLITNWETLANIIEKISAIDMSNLNTLQGQENLEATQQAAADKYNIYQSLEDQVKDGKTVSKSEFKTLQPEIQQFFSMMANGSYKMTGDAQKFYQTVENLKIDGFIQAAQAVNSELEKVHSLQDFTQSYKDDANGERKDFDYQKYNKAAVQQVQGAPSGIQEVNEEALKVQLDYLEAVSATNPVLQELVGGWQDALKEGEANVALAQQIAEQYEKAGDQTQKLEEQQGKLTQAARELAHQTYEAMYPLDEDVDPKQLQNMTKVIQEMAEKSEELADSLGTDGEAAEDVAASILRFDDAIQDVTDNYDDWMKALQNGSLQDQAEVTEGLKDAYSDLLDLDGQSLSNSFLQNTDNLQKMKEAANGSTQAYDELLQRAGQDILTQVGLDTAQFYSDRDLVYSAIEQLSGTKFPDIEVGAKLNDADFLNGLTNMVNAAGMTAKQATDYLASMGIDAEVIEDTSKSTESNEISGYKMTKHYESADAGYIEVPSGSGTNIGTTRKELKASMPYFTAEPDKQTVKTSKESKAMALKVTSAKKSSGGGFKFKQSKHGGGSAGGSGGSGKKGGSGGGGGGGGGSKKSSTPTGKRETFKQDTKKITHVTGKQADPYYTINQQLSAQQAILKKLQRATEKTFGRKRVESLEKEAAAILKINEQLKKKIELNKTEVKNAKDALKTTAKKYGMTATFDSETGAFTNYTDIYEKAVSEANAKADKAETARTTYNTAAQRDAELKEYATLLQKDKPTKKEKAKIKKYREKYGSQIRTALKMKKGDKITAAKVDKYTGKVSGTTKEKELKRYKTLLQKKKKKKLSKKEKDQLKKLQKKYGKKSITQLDKMIKSNKTVSDLQTEKDNARTEADNAAKDIDTYQKKADDYDKELETQRELQEQDQEQLRDYYSKLVEAHNEEIQIKIDFGQAERDWNNFKNNVLHGQNVLVDDNMSQIIKNVKNSWDNLVSYFQSSFNDKETGFFTSYNEILNLQKEIQNIKKFQQTNTDPNAKKPSERYGDNLDLAEEDLKNMMDTFKEQFEGIYDHIGEIRQAFLDMADAVDEAFDEQIDKYEHINDLIQGSIDLLQLMYGQKNYEAMNKYYDNLHQNQLDQIDLLRRQSNFWYQEWQQALDRGQKETAKKFEEKYMETFQNLNSKIADSIKTLQEQYANAINSIFDELDKRMTSGFGSEYVEMDWELTNKNNEGFLDAIDAAYAVDELQSKFQDLLDNTKSVKNQQNIKKVMDEQLDNLKSKEKLTQYDIDRANQLLEIEQARAALEDAQNAKTQLRLKRDSQGNYSYEYTADQNASNEAFEKLKQAQNQLNKLDKEQYKSNLDEMLAAWKDFQSQYIEIQTDASIGDEERAKKLTLLEEKYAERVKNLTQQNANIKSNLMESTQASLADLYGTSLDSFKTMTKEQMNELMEEIYPSWSSGIQDLFDSIVKEGGFETVISSIIEKIEKKTQQYKANVANVGIIGGQDFEDVKNGLNDVADAYSKFIKSSIGSNEEFAKSLRNNINTTKNFVYELGTLLKEIEQKGFSEEVLEHMTDFMMKQTTSDWENDDAWKNSSMNRIKTSGQVATNTDSSQITLASLYSFEQLHEMAKEENRQATQEMLNQYDKEHGTKLLEEWLKKVAAFATGGYTGDWNNNDGRFALLHQKELVLNESDTKNLLDTITILRTIDTSLNTNLFSKMQDIGNQSVKDNYTDTVIEQQVHIEASFPNVNSKRQIEEAFNDLVNLAAQRAMKQR